MLSLQLLPLFLFKEAFLSLWATSAMQLSLVSPFPPPFAKGEWIFYSLYGTYCVGARTPLSKSTFLHGTWQGRSPPGCVRIGATTGSHSVHCTSLSLSAIRGTGCHACCVCVWKEGRRISDALPATKIGPANPTELLRMNLADFPSTILGFKFSLNSSSCSHVRTLKPLIMRCETHN